MQPTVHNSSRWFSSAGQQELYDPFPDFSQERLNSLFRKQSLLQYNLVPYAPYFQLATLLFHPPSPRTLEASNRNELTAELSWSHQMPQVVLTSLCLSWASLLKLDQQHRQPMVCILTPVLVAPMGCPGVLRRTSMSRGTSRGEIPMEININFLTAEHLKRGALENIQKTFKKRRKSRNSKATAIDLIIHDHWTARFSLDSWKVFPT